MEFTHINNPGNNILKSFGIEDDSIETLKNILEKAEGSRGGKIIGHTRSGKPIYDSFNHPKHKDFNAHDHTDAADAQNNLVQKHREKNKPKALAHFAESEKHGKEAWKQDPEGEFMKKYQDKSKEKDAKIIIGNTKSGKFVFENHDHPNHEKFTAEEHKDAANVNWNRMAEHKVGSEEHKNYRKNGNKHYELSEKMSKNK
jgi:hypothetical protein